MPSVEKETIIFSHIVVTTKRLQNQLYGSVIELSVCLVDGEGAKHEINISIYE